MPDLSTAQEIGLALVLMAVMLGVGWWLRRRLRALQALHVPASVVTGFVILLLGPGVLGAVTGTNGLFPERVLEVWRVLPGLLINVVFAAILIGKTLPAARDVWRAAAPHAIFGSFLSFGQFALGGLLVMTLLGPVFGVAPEAGALLEMSFAGGHGTIAGMGGLLEDAGAPELVDVGLGLATVSMLTGVIVGTWLVRWAITSPRVQVARSSLPSADDVDVDQLHIAPVDEPEDDRSSGIHALTLACSLIGLAIVLAIVLLWSSRWIGALLGSDLLDSFPLFPVTVIGGAIVQLAVSRTRAAPQVDKRAVEGLSAIALDTLVASAIGTMSLATLGANLPAMFGFTVVGVAWSVVSLRWLAPRLHGRGWFEHAVADFGQSQGNVATGFVLADMVDPRRRTSAANDYGYKQLIYEPLLGGGILTALAVPLITDYGVVPFTVVAALITLALAVWGVRRRSRLDRSPATSGALRG